jgi:energy-coupling factor transport system permease protein
MGIRTKLDPRGKLACACLSSLGILWADSVTGLTAMAAFVVSFGLMTGMDLPFLAKRFSSVFWFVVIVISLNTFTRDGEVLGEFAGLIATREGLEAGVFLSTRVFLLLVSSVFFVRSTPLSELTDGITVLARPIRKHAGPIIQVLVIALHFVPLFIQRARRIKMVQIARGADVETRFLGQIRFARAAVVPLFVGSLRAADQLALAMDARCYEPSAFRTSYAELTMRAADLAMLVAAAACCIVSLSV